MRFALALLVGMMAALCVSGCFPSRRAADQDYKNFVAGAERAPEYGYKVYWLGRQFSAGGLTFTGPSVSDFRLDEARDDGLDMSYDAVVLDGRGGVGFDIALYSTAQWQRRETQGLNRLPPATTTRPVNVAGQSGTLLMWRSSPRGIELRLDLGGSMLRAHAVEATNALTPGGSQLNPLIDEQTFLSVLEQLRPYPQ